MSVIFSVKNISPGMSLADDVLDASGRLLVAAFTTLDEKKIRTLKSWGISEVSVEKESAGLPITEAEKGSHGENRANILNRFQCNDRDHKAVVEFVKLLMER